NGRLVIHPTKPLFYLENQGPTWAQVTAIEADHGGPQTEWGIEGGRCKCVFLNEPLLDPKEQIPVIAAPIGYMYTGTDTKKYRFDIVIFYDGPGGARLSSRQEIYVEVSNQSNGSALVTPSLGYPSIYVSDRG